MLSKPFKPPNLLHIESLGKGSPLVLIHGWGWDSRIWQPLLPFLSEKFTLFLVDLPGCGQSGLSQEQDYTLDSIIPMILDKVPKQAAWLGWSLGGLFALSAAARYPDNVSHLITITSSPKFVSDVGWAGISASALEKFSLQLNQDQEKTVNNFLALQFRNYFKKIDFNNLKPLYTHADALKKGLLLLSSTDIRHDLSKITIPSLHIFGEIDTIVPVKVVPQIQSLVSSKSKCIVMKRAGHLPFLTQPEEFLQILSEFY